MPSSPPARCVAGILCGLALAWSAAPTLHGYERVYRLFDQRDGLPADCRVSLDEQEIAASDLPGRVAELLGGQPRGKRVLFLAADDSLNYEGVLRIVDLAKSGVDDLTIGVITSD